MCVNATTGLFGWSEAVWVSISAIVSAGVAVVTYLMARYTKRLAVETKTISDSALTQAIQIERHHRQALSPVVVARISVTSFGFGGNSMVQVKGTIKNVGPGPAVRLTFMLRPRNLRVVTKEMEALGPGETREINDSFGAAGRLTRYGTLGYYCAIRFTDLFEQDGWTVQRSRNGADTLLIEYQNPVQRLTEDAVVESGRKSWRTFKQATRQFDADDMDYDTDDFQLSGRDFALKREGFDVV